MVLLEKNIKRNQLNVIPTKEKEEKHIKCTLKNLFFRNLIILILYMEPITNGNIRERIDQYFANIENNIPQAPINTWDVSQVTDMSRLFANRTTFNERLDHWDVRNVRTMAYMFQGCTSFNQPLCANVHNMYDTAHSLRNSMYRHADVCIIDDLPPITRTFRLASNPMRRSAEFLTDRYSTWDVSRVVDMRYMFNGCTDFNQPLNNWNVSRVYQMQGMFSGCIVFNQPLNNWNVSRLENITGMFENTLNFAQDLSGWTLRYNIPHGHTVFIGSAMIHHINLMPPLLRRFYHEERRINPVNRRKRDRDPDPDSPSPSPRRTTRSMSTSVKDQKKKQKKEKATKKKKNKKKKIAHKKN